MTTLIKWPANLPASRIGATFKPVNPMLSTKLENGRKRYRRNFTAVPVDFSADWIMTDAQLNEFFDFYQNALIDGSEWFEMPIMQPLGLQNFKVHFESAYDYRLISAPLAGKETGRYWKVTAEMSMYLRPEPKELPTDYIAPENLQGGYISHMRNQIFLQWDLLGRKPKCFELYKSAEPLVLEALPEPEFIEVEKRSAVITGGGGIPYFIAIGFTENETLYLSNIIQVSQEGGGFVEFKFKFEADYTPPIGNEIE